MSRWLGAHALALLGGCSLLFPFGTGDAPAADAGVEPDAEVGAHLDGGDGSTEGCFRDDFEDGSFDPRWTPLAPNGIASVAEVGGELVVTLTPSEPGYNGLVASAIDLSADSAIEVDLVQSASQAGFVETTFAVVPGDGDRYLFSTGAGNFLMRAVLAAGANDDVSAPWDPSLYRRLRIRHDLAADVMRFETSADGTAWTERRTAGVATSLSSVELQLIAGAWDTGNATPGEAHFDDVRVATPACP